MIGLDSFIDNPGTLSSLLGSISPQPTGSDPVTNAFQVAQTLANEAITAQQAQQTASLEHSTKLSVGESIIGASDAIAGGGLSAQDTVQDVSQLADTLNSGIQQLNAFSTSDSGDLVKGLKSLSKGLSSIGVTISDSGQVTVDQNALATALQNAPNGTQALLTGPGGLTEVARSAADKLQSDPTPSAPTYDASGTASAFWAEEQGMFVNLLS